MTSLQCKRCGKYWTIQTLYPEKFDAIGRFCPICIVAALPLMGGA